MGSFGSPIFKGGNMPDVNIDLFCDGCGRALDVSVSRNGSWNVELCTRCIDSHVADAIDNYEQEIDDRYQEGYDDGYKKAMEDYGE